MSLIVPTDVLEIVLINLLQDEDLALRLYANNYNPSPDMVIGSFTEVSGGGYAAITIDKDDWTFDNNGLIVIATNLQKTFTFTGTTGGSGVVYGYYITDVAGTALYYAEALPGSVSPFTPANGAFIKITPQLQASGGN